MKNRNKTLIAVGIVLLIIVLVGGATYAYWTWTSSNAQKTNISFTIPDMIEEGFYANLNGSGNVAATKLAPAECTNATYAIKKTITITHKNTTPITANVTATLSAKSLTWKYGNQSGVQGKLSNIKYALTTSSSNCTTGAVKTGTLSGLTVGATANTAATQNIKLFDQTFTSPANAANESTQTYYLWVWIDKNYAHQNVGNANSDPLQDIAFNLEWSGHMEQIAS